MFATIVVVLPSTFTGGAVHLSHGGASTVYDSSASSAFATTVLAWYTDVTHEIKPIASGHRLALSYNLFRTKNTLGPSPLGVKTQLSAELRRIFLCWERSALRDEPAPEQLLYLLAHKYSRATLGARALKGADAQKVALLLRLAKEVGFGMGLANASCKLVGDCEADGDDEDLYGDGGEGDFEMGDVHDREMTVEHLVTMQGNIIKSRLDFEEDDVIPHALAENVEDYVDFDKEAYQGYMGNVRSHLDVVLHSADKLIGLNSIPARSSDVRHPLTLLHCPFTWLTSIW